MTNKAKKDEKTLRRTGLQNLTYQQTKMRLDASERNDSLQGLRQENPPLHRPAKRPRSIHEGQYRAPREVLHPRHLHFK